eukprot:6455308-Amphidinium_carterae.1
MQNKKAFESSGSWNLLLERGQRKKTTGIQQQRRNARPLHQMGQNDTSTYLLVVNISVSICEDCPNWGKA